MLNLFTILVFLFVLLGVLGLRAFTNRARREEMVRERLTELLTQVEEEAKSVAPVEYPDESVLMGLDDYHGHFPKLHARIVRIQKGLELLGWTKNLRLRVLVLGALSFTAAALVGRMTDYPFLIAFFGGAALFASAAALLYLRAMGEWTEDLGKSLPEAIDSIARICRAGVPAQTAFGLAAQNLRGALSEELRTIDRWLRLGVPLKQVLQESAHRVPLPEYRFFAVIVIISQESGGRLADTLERLAATLRERAELALKVQAKTSEARASIKIVACLVPGVLIYQYIQAPQDFQFLVTDINMLSYGDFPEIANDYSDKSIQIPRGAILNGNLNEVFDVDTRDPEQVQEFVDHSWYKYPEADKGLHPWDGITDQHYELPPGSDGTETKFNWLAPDGKYSWIKSPRWRGHMMEVGPLARMVIGIAKNVPHFKEPALELLKELNLPLEAAFSTLGRHAARALECQWMTHKLAQYIDDLTANIKAGDETAANMEFWEPKTWPKECRGVGPCEAPRGALAHYCVIKNGRLENWQAVVPTTWNASPRSSEGQKGTYELSLIGTPLAYPKRPLEIIRTIHSFDPCLACATHLYSPEGEELTSVQVC